MKKNEHISCSYFPAQVQRIWKAAEKDEGFTVEKEIDGWRDSDTGKAEQKTDRMRLDYIFSSEKREILTSEVICNGKKYPIVSDHCGVMITVK